MKLASKSVCALMLAAAFFTGPAAAEKKGITPKPPPPVETSSIKGESADDKHRPGTELEVRKAGEHPQLGNSAISPKNLKGH
jgi:hypothetical protein